MKTYLMSLGIEVQANVLVGYEELKTINSDKDHKLEFTTNAKAMKALISVLSESEFIKVMHCKIAKAISDKLENIHEGDTKVKMAKLQVYRMQFQTLKMNEDEDISNFFLRVDEVANVMMGLRETIRESVTKQKILRLSPSKFNPKALEIEETSNFETLNKVQLIGSLTTYDMRISKGKLATRDATFKTNKTTKDKEGKEQV